MMAHVAKAMPAAHLLVQACQHVWLVLDDGACANVHICWSYPSIPSASPHSCSQVRPCLTARLTGYPGGYIVPRASHRAVASSACPGRERLMEQPVSSSHFFLLKQRFMRLLVARCASSLASRPVRAPITDAFAPAALRAPLAGGVWGRACCDLHRVTAFSPSRSARTVCAGGHLAGWPSSNLDCCAAPCLLRSRAIPPGFRSRRTT